MNDRSIIQLLAYARGDVEIKQWYIAYYRVTSDGEIVIESCSRQNGTSNTEIRFRDYSGEKIEPEVDRKEVEMAIKRFVKSWDKSIKEAER